MFLIACVTYNNDVHNIKLISNKKGKEYDQIRRCFDRNISLHTSVCSFVKHNFLEGHLYQFHWVFTPAPVGLIVHVLSSINLINLLISPTFMSLV